MTAALLLLRQFWFVIPMIALLIWGEYWHHEVKDVRKDLAVVQAQYDGFKKTVEAEGREAKAKADAQIATSQLETANVQNTLTAALADNKRLQGIAAAARSRSGYLPPVPAGSTNANSAACFDRPKLDAALSGFGTAVAGLVAEGTDATVYRDFWLRWYDGQVKAAKPN